MACKRSADNVIPGPAQRGKGQEKIRISTDGQPNAFAGGNLPQSVNPCLSLWISNIITPDT